MYDCIILGGGPAGISAGIYVKRTGCSVLVLDNDQSTLSSVRLIQNFYGVGPISGAELKAKGVEQYVALGGEYEQCEALSIAQTNAGFAVSTNKGERLAKTIILALGAGKKKTVPGLERFENANVSYCAVCDGFFYQGKTVAVIGEGEFAIHEANELSKNAKTVYIIGENCKKSIKLAKNIQVIDKNAIDFVGKDMVEGVVFEDKSRVKVDGVFVALGSLSTFELCKQMGILTQDNRVLVDKHFMTNIVGVFAAGDCIGGLLQVAKAVSDGAEAGLEAVRYIKTLEE